MYETARAMSKGVQGDVMECEHLSLAAMEEKLEGQ